MLPPSILNAWNVVVLWLNANKPMLPIYGFLLFLFLAVAYIEWKYKDEPDDFDKFDGFGW